MGARTQTMTDGPMMGMTLLTSLRNGMIVMEMDMATIRVLELQ